MIPITTAGTMLNGQIMTASVPVPWIYLQASPKYHCAFILTDIQPYNTMKVPKIASTMFNSLTSKDGIVAFDIGEQKGKWL